MKRITAIILTLVMLVLLIPVGIVAQAETVTAKPFYMVNWSLPEAEFDHIYYMPFTWISESAAKNATNEVNITFTVYNSTDVKDIAQKMKEDFDARPEGARFFNFMALQTILIENVVDVVDMERGVQLTKDWTTRFLAEYKSIGGKLDGIAVDLEYFRASSYYINDKQYSKENKDVYNQIVANSVYKNRIRPELVKRGFEFYTNPNPSKYPHRSEIWTIYTKDSDGGKAKCRSIWDQVIDELLCEYINEAAFEPLMEYYPNAVLSDYTTGNSYGWLKGMSHTGSQSSSNSAKAGNASNYNFYDYATGYVFYGYGSESNRTKRTKYQKPASYNDAVFADAPFSRTNWEVNTFKRLLTSTDTGKVNAWITFFNYGTYGPGYSRTPYYSELIYHLGMANPEPFFGYILKSEVLDKGYDDPHPDVCEYDYNLKVVDELMAELTRVAGASDRKAIVTPITWNEGFFFSGMYAGGRNIWRLTPDTSKVSVEDFKVKDKAPTFSANGVTITFPQGRIIEDSSITHVGTCGYWIETPANVVPVVTSTANRYSDNPSFLDNFNSYETGSFTSNAVLPNTYWTVTGSAAIQESSGNKVLALSGNASISNTKVPQNITAGDDYAKQQAWEVTVTLPSDSYGDVKLLSCAEKDGGIKISGGKLYYDQAGSYQELGGVSLPAGTYTIKREVDFRTAGRYTSSYSVYNSAGTWLGGVDDIPMAAVTLPVSTIHISTAGASSAVLIDDYKLYPTGVTTVLELYDAQYGRELTDITSARTENTAYRLSWMNASSQYKVARIYDAKSGSVIKTVEMAPGMDGVATGIVDANAGKSVIVSVKVEDGTAPSRPNYDNGNFGWTATVAENLGLAVGPKPAGSTGGDTGSNNGGSTGENAGDNGDSSGGVIDFENIGNTEGTTGVLEPGDNNTVNNDNAGSSTGEPTREPVSKKGLGGGMIALIVIGSILVLAGGCVAVFLFAVKPKLTETSPAWLLKLAAITDFTKSKKPNAEQDMSATRKIDIPEDDTSEL